MKAGDAKAPKFESNWWKANKAKAADPTGLFEKALVKYQKEKKGVAATAGGTSVELDAEGLKKVLLEVKNAAAKTKADPKLGTFQKETKDALASYEKLCDSAIADIQRIPNAPILKMKTADLMRSAPQFQAYCKKTQQDENFNFLSLMAKNPKKEQRWYDAFIKPGAKFQVNLPAPLVKEFTKLATGPDTPENWNQAPWDKAVEEITRLVERDVVPRFRKYATAQLLMPKLP